MELIDDEIEVFSSAILGLTIKCARCHSHKFDPIPQRDYYRLAAIFKGALDEHDWLKPDRQAKFEPGERDRFLPYVTTKEYEAWKAAGGKPENQPLIRALWDRGGPSPTYILKRGNHLTPGRLVGPGVPSVLTDGKTPLKLEPPGPKAKKTGRRLALAKWLITADHPLTSRVMVNRDLISVWSSGSSDKGRRFGLVEFDISSVADLDLTRAHLELGVLDTNPIRQSAAVIAAGVDGYNWKLFQQNKAADARAVTGLGRYRFDMAAERIGGYAAGSGATPEALKLIKAKARSDGRLTLVLMADEDGAAYRRDWDDGVYRRTRNNPPRLVIYDSRRDPHLAARRALHSFCHTLINSAAFLYID